MTEKRPYETTVILNAGLDDAALLAQVEQITEFLKNNGATMVATSNWGRKRLAYPIQKKHNGYYAYFLYEAPASLHPLVERMFSLNESLLRHLSLQLTHKEYEFRKNNIHSSPASLDEVRKQAREAQEKEAQEKEALERAEKKQPKAGMPRLPEVNVSSDDNSAE